MKKVLYNRYDDEPIIIFVICVWFHSDDDGKDDDIIFEDFARLRLKGAETEA